MTAAVGQRNPLLDEFKRKADRYVAAVQNTERPRLARILHHAATELHDNGNAEYFRAIENLARVPVTMDEFMDSREYFRDQYEELWPVVRQDLRNINPDILAGEQPVHEYFDGGACLDSETEYLSRTGWRRLSEYDGCDVAQYHPETGSVSYVQPLRYVDEPHTEEWLHFKTRFGVDMKLTPGHRVFHYDRSGKEARILSAEDIAEKHMRLSNGFLGKFETCYTDADRPGVNLSDAVLRLMVVLSADGYVAPDEVTAPVKVQLKKQRKIDRLEGLLKAAAVTYYISHKAGGYTVFNFDLPDHRKRYADWAWDCTPAQCAVLCSEVMYWDGDSVSKNKYASAHRSDVDFMQHAFANAGVRTTVYEDTREGKYTDNLWVLTTSGNRLVSLASATKDGLSTSIEPHSRKYCFTVPTSLFIARRNGRVFVTGNTGTAKSFKSMATQAYQLYCLTCYKRPQSLAKLPRSTPIVFMFQSVAEGITRRVLYEPFRQMFTEMPYVKKWVKYDKYRETALYLTDLNIQVIPALANVKKMVGQAIISGILDEVNFMTVVERSKMVMGKAGEGGKYDQAEIAYNTISRRRKGRFARQGPIPGCISVMSSVKYKGDFLDRKIKSIEAAQRDGKEYALQTKIYQRAQYEVVPSERFKGPKFQVLVGSDNYNTRVLEDADERGVTYPESATVLEAPIEYLENFEADPDGALRDVCGMATDTINPFFTQRHKVIQAVMRGRERGLLQWVDNPNVVLAKDGMPQVAEDNLPLDLDTPRFVHIDLSKTKDRCGIAVVKVDGYTNVTRKGHVESLPHYTVELAVSIEPSSTHELDIAEVRNWVLNLKSFYGLNIVMVSYDGFQSTESMQAVRRAGVRSELTSMDVSTEPYDDLKRAYYEDRVDSVDNEILRLELTNLEINHKTGKVDHTPRGSKDISDAVAGACYRAARFRTNRIKHRMSEQDSGKDMAPGRKPKAAPRRRNLPRRRK